MFKPVIKSEYGGQVEKNDTFPPGTTFKVKCYPNKIFTLVISPDKKMYAIKISPPIEGSSFHGIWGPDKWVKIDDPMKLKLSKITSFWDYFFVTTVPNFNKKIIEIVEERWKKLNVDFLE